MNSRILRLCLPIGLAVVVLAACGAPPVPASQAAVVSQVKSVAQAVVDTPTVMAPPTVAIMPTAMVTATATITPTVMVTATEAVTTSRMITVPVGAGRETVTVNSFFPYALTVREGDTVHWKLNTDEVHTVSFVDGKVPPGADPKTYISDPRFGAGPDDKVPGPFAQVPGGGPTDLMLNPATAFATRPPGGPVETWDGNGFASSGTLSDIPAGPPGTPPNNTFDLKFTKAGTYHYICLIHYQSMQGVVTVLPATATDVPSQADVDAQAKKEMDNQTPLLDIAKAGAQQPLKEVGPNNHTIWKVRAGNAPPDTFDARAQLLQFGPKDLTIKAGDTVVWGSSYFHTVTFKPAPPPPDFPTVKPQPNGPPLLIASPDVVFPVKPAATYDPTKYYNSGILTPGGPNGTDWALTFDKPGTYEYFCVVHYLQGMKATITVTP